MRPRLKVLVALLILTAGSLAAAWVHENHDYLFPRDVCYTRRGEEIGDYERCRANPTLRVLVEGAISRETMMGPREAYSHRICQRECRELDGCTHYVFRLPIEFHSHDIMGERGVYGCTLFGQVGQ